MGYHTEIDYQAARKTYEEGIKAAREVQAQKDKAEEDAGLEERTKAKAASTNFRYHGMVMNGAELVEHLIAKGHTALAVCHVGAVAQYSLRNPESEITVRVLKKDGTLDYAVILIDKLELAQAALESEADCAVAAQLFTTQR